MSASIALLMYALFTTLALWKDCKSRSRVSHAIWIPFTWLVICASRSLTQWLNLSGSIGMDYDDANLQGSPIDRIFLTLLMALGILVLLKRQHRLFDLLRNNKAILLFFLFLGMSTLWSDVSEVSLRRWLRLVGGLLMVTVILTELDPIVAVKIALRRCAYLLIPLSVIYIKYFPELGV